MSRLSVGSSTAFFVCTHSPSANVVENGDVARANAARDFDVKHISVGALGYSVPDNPNCHHLITLVSFH